MLLSYRWLLKQFSNTLAYNGAETSGKSGTQRIANMLIKIFDTSWIRGTCQTRFTDGIESATTRHVRGNMYRSIYAILAHFAVASSNTVCDWLRHKHTHVHTWRRTYLCDMFVHSVAFRSWQKELVHRKHYPVTYTCIYLIIHLIRIWIEQIIPSKIPLATYYARVAHVWSIIWKRFSTTKPAFAENGSLTMHVYADKLVSI